MKMDMKNKLVAKCPGIWSARSNEHVMPTISIEGMSLRQLTCHIAFGSNLIPKVTEALLCLPREGHGWSVLDLR